MIQFTRRDTLLALIGSSAVTGMAVHETTKSLPDDTGELSRNELETLRAVAEVVYPSEVTQINEFLRGYLARLGPQRVAKTRKSLRQLNRLSRRTFGQPFHARSEADRDRLLRKLGVDRAHSKAEGTVAEEVRYHLVNSLLYALFTDPKGSQLFGIQNPRGYPGGLQHYQTKS